CFGCVLLFIRHNTFASEKVVLGEVSCISLIESWLPQMIQIEGLLRQSEGDGSVVNSVTKSLFYIVMAAEEQVRSFRSQLIPQISSVIVCVLQSLKAEIEVFSKKGYNSIMDLFDNYRDALGYIFDAYQFDSLIIKHFEEIVLCCECMNEIIVQITSDEFKSQFSIAHLNIIVSALLDHISRSEKVLAEASCEDFDNGRVTEILCNILFRFASKTKIHPHFFRQSIAPTLKSLLERGGRVQLFRNAPLYLLKSLKLFSISPSLKDQLLALLGPCFGNWVNLNHGNECDGLLMIILANISQPELRTTSLTFSKIQNLFVSIIDTVEECFTGGWIVAGESHTSILEFFSNVIRLYIAHADVNTLEVYYRIRGLLDGWFSIIKGVEHVEGAVLWSKCIATLSSSSALLPLLSPKHDEDMKWCKERGCEHQYLEYQNQCFPSLHKLNDFFDLFDILSKEEVEDEVITKLINDMAAILYEFNEIFEGLFDEMFLHICEDVVLYFSYGLESFFQLHSPMIFNIFKRMNETISPGETADRLYRRIFSILTHYADRTPKDGASTISHIIPHSKDIFRVYQDSPEQLKDWIKVLALSSCHLHSDVPNKTM
ncbi:hypothetical protein ADUPG1_000503, partial [Aduncisulcus paluster]